MNDLRALAEAARGDNGHWYPPAAFTSIVDDDGADVFESADADYIAACSPDRILALLDVVDAAREYVLRLPESRDTALEDDLRAALDALEPVVSHA